MERPVRHFEEELEALQSRLLEMGGLAEERVRASVQGPVTRDARSDTRVMSVGKPAALARALLNQHIVTGGDESLRTGGNQRDTILVCLDFLWNADLHGIVMSLTLVSQAK